jgi:hypothetical protein
MDLRCIFTTTKQILGVIAANGRVTIIFIVLFNEKQLPLTSTKINPSFLVLYLNPKITEKILRS